ncbi:MAG: glycosyltransferase [Patescibacteria group bacterium]
MTSNFNEKKLRILELGTTDTKGGAAAVSWELKQSLEARGHAVNMIVGYKRSHAPSVREIWDTPFNNRISKIIKRNFRARFHHHLSFWLSNDIAFLPGKRILTYPEYTHADIVHAHNLHSLWFNLKTLPLIAPYNQPNSVAIQQCSRSNKPLVWTLHDMWPILGQGAHAFECTHWISGGCDCAHSDSLPPLRRNNSRHLWKLKKQIYDHAHFNVVVPSLWLKSQVEKSMLKDKPLHVIYNGVDTRLYKPGNKGELRKKYNLPQDKKIILFSSKGGAKNVWKGWEYAEQLIHAYAQRNDILFVCMGGYDRTVPQNLNITYVPFSSDSHTIADYYALSDLLLYPSLADNCPLTVLEALSSGLPALAFHTGGIPELVVHKEHGYIAAYKDLSDLTNGFEWLINLPRDQYAAIAAACRKRAVEKFSLDQMVNNYITLYYQILSSPS